MKLEQRKDFRTSVILSEDQHRKLNAMAAENDVSVAWLIRQAITRLLDEGKSSGVGIRQPKNKRK
jgi:predicted transcriptional regulator